MPRYLKRRERPWFRRAAALLKRLPAEQPVLAGNRPTVAG
jgi:glutathione S-transferase